MDEEIAIDPNAEELPKDHGDHNLWLSRELHRKSHGVAHFALLLQLCSGPTSSTLGGDHQNLTHDIGHSNAEGKEHEVILWEVPSVQELTWPWLENDQTQKS